MFVTRVSGGEAFAVEHKIRQLKKLLFKSKTLNKRLKERIKANNLIAKPTNNMTNVKAILNLFRYRKKGSQF